MAADFYGGNDPLEVPLYTYADASHYLGIPSRTVSYWVKGRSYATQSGGNRKYEPVLQVKNEHGLSFLDLVQLHVLNGLRKTRGVSLQNIRSALDIAERELGIDRLLLDERLRTLGTDIFIKHLGEVINLSKGGQYAIKEILEHYLRRVERNDNLIPIKFYPDITPAVQDDDAPEKPISINPLVAFGMPTITGTGIRTRAIADRYDAGETIDELAYDYQLDNRFIDSAIRYENAA